MGLCCVCGAEIRVCHNQFAIDFHSPGVYAWDARCNTSDSPVQRALSVALRQIAGFRTEAKAARKPRERG